MKNVPIEDVVIYGLQSGKGGMAVSIVSYNGDIKVSVVSDIPASESAVCDTALVSEFMREYQLLLSSCPCSAADVGKVGLESSSMTIA
jgi:hypothetical protein